MYYIFPLTAGVTIVLSMIQNGHLAGRIGIRNTTLLNFITGFTGTLLIFIFTRESLITYGAFRDVPSIGYIGGILGVTVVMISSAVIRRISVIASTMLIYAGQLFMGIIIDLTRGTELSLGKLAGCVLIVVGVYINAKIDVRSRELQTSF